MLGIIGTVVPVFLVIVLGHLLTRFRFVDDGVASGLEHVCYYVLFPALIVRTVALADFSTISVTGLIAGFWGALAVAAALLILLRPLIKRAFGLDDPGFTSLFQGSMRWHGFMALAMATALFGTEAVPIVAVGLAALVPPLNVISVWVLIKWGDRPEASTESIGRQIAKNPFILACALGAALNVTGIGMPEPVSAAMKLLGDAALGVTLLATGAGLRPITTNGETGAIVFCAAYRLLLMPVIFFAALTLAGVTGHVRTVAVLCGAVPTAASAYVLARKLGGNAPLMAGMITAQTLAAAVTLPVVIYLLTGLE
jgi:predicted permease